MRIDLKQTKAKNCPTDVFVFIPKAFMFFWVDNVDVTEKETSIEFEMFVDKDGLHTVTYKFKNTEDIYYYKP